MLDCRCIDWSTEVNFKLDTGAEVTVHETLADSMPLPFGAYLTNLGHTPLHVIGQFFFYVHLQWENITTHIKGLRNNLLGFPEITALKVMG